MASVDCEPLLLPLPGASPAGDESHFVLTLAPALRELRREESADEFDGATRPTKLKRADWPEVARLCEEALATHAKDLRTACHLTEARLRLEGLGGLRAGLELVARLVDECWDRLTPPEGDDPADSRGTPLANLLDDPDRGVCFPNLVRTLPLIGEGDAALSFVEWTRMRSGGPDQLNLVREHATPERLQQCHTDATGALFWLDSLRGALEVRLGEHAPGLLNLRSALSDIGGLLEEELSRLGFPAEAAGETEQNDSATQGSTGPASQREELYKTLDTTAERLQAMEPHSPIPYLIKRAVRLGRMPFPRLMRQVIRDAAVLSELSREFGVAETTEENASA